MQTITLDDVITAGRKAYEAKTLTAQSINPACAYEDLNTGCRCVVGSALSDETHMLIREAYFSSSKVTSLVREEKVLGMASKEDEIAIAGLQEAHDAWCRALQIGVNAEAAEGEFTYLLYR